MAAVYRHKRLFIPSVVPFAQCNSWLAQEVGSIQWSNLEVPLVKSIFNFADWPQLPQLHFSPEGCKKWVLNKESCES